MPWLKKAAEAPTTDKIWELSNELYRLYDASLHYCAKELTDGHIAASRISPLTPKPATKQQIDALVVRRLWHRLPDICASCQHWRAVKEAGPLSRTGYLVHDFLEFNPSRVQWERRQRGLQEGGKKGAAARWHEPETDGSGHDLTYRSGDSPSDGVGHEAPRSEADGSGHRSGDGLRDGPYSVPRTPSSGSIDPVVPQPEPDVPDDEPVADEPPGAVRSREQGRREGVRHVRSAAEQVVAQARSRAAS
jgi:hypothetical protein